MSWATQRLIRTPDQRLRIFVSSTLGELAAERAAARTAIEQLRLVPVMFELGARPHAPRALYQAYLDQSDIFIGIYWQRYGWVAEGINVSGVEDEYRLCGERPRLVYVKTPAPAIEPRLADLLLRIEEDGQASYRRFETPDELHALIADDLALLLSEAFGWSGSSFAAVGDRVGSNRLPVPLTRLIGRERESAELCSLLADQAGRLVTITGAGGTGKSRLALEAARCVAGAFKDGAVFVDLAPIRSAELALAEVARALGIQHEGHGELLDTVIDHLKTRSVLLVLDNFEQVVDAAPQLAAVLTSCPDVAALVTSRVPLLVRGEREYRADPLPTSAMSSSNIMREIAAAPATQLFVERAADALPGFELTEENALAVADICRRVDGLPLALELVAARVRVLPPAALLERLSRRLDLEGAADLPERQRTLRATIDWSFGLLDGAGSALFAQLAIFSGGFTVPAVEAVCGDAGKWNVVDTLSSLVEQSLVAAQTSITAEPRFRMLETVREYALERLRARSDGEELARRHAQYFVSICEDAESGLHGPEQRFWFARLDQEIGNLRALVEWAQGAGEHELIIRAWWTTMLYWWVRDAGIEMQAVLEKIVPLPQTTSVKTRGEASWLLAAVRLLVGDGEGARPLLQQSLAFAREAGDLRATALSLSMLAAVSPRTEGPDGAWELAREALAIARRLEWSWGIAYTLHHLGDTAIRDRDAAAVIAFNTECLAIAREIENEPLMAMALWQLGWAYVLEGDEVRARESLAESASLCRRLHSAENMSYCLDGFAALAMATGDLQLAARLVGAANAVRDRLRMAPFPPLAETLGAFRAPVRASLGEADFNAEHAAGASMSSDEVLALVLAPASPEQP